MISNVDIDLLEQTYQNATMGIEAIEAVLDKVEAHDLVKDLQQQLVDYQEIANKSKEQLINHRVNVKDKSVYDKAMLKSGIWFNTMKDSSDSHIVEMVIKGSTMGITQMTKLLNDHKNADGDSTKIAKEFIKKEEKNIDHLKAYL